MLRVAFQAAFLFAVLGLLLYLLDNLVFNLQRLGIPRSFDYLDQPAGFAIADSDFRSSQSVLDAALVGVRNTVTVSLAGIAVALVLGILIGIGRLSGNWLVRRSAAAYVETFRNIPVLVIILFFYLGVILRLPPIGRAVEFLDLVVLSNRGLVVPSVARTGPLLVLVAVLVVGALLAALAFVWRTRRFDATGEPHHRVLWAVGILALAAMAGFLAAGRPLGLSLPERGDLGVDKGFRVGPEYAALFLGLTIYTASHIAEIVRGSIQAVPRGQTEASHAVGLSGFQRLRFVVLPQAFRIMIPPLSNQFLNLTKNSSLGVAVAFPEVTRITRITIAQGAPAPQAILVLMGIYLALSLTIALIANLINRRLTLRGR